MRHDAIVEEFWRLTSDEKLQLLRRLWQEMETDEGGRPLADEEHQFLAQRLREIDQDPRPDRDWDDVRAELSTPR